MTRGQYGRERPDGRDGQEELERILMRSPVLGASAASPDLCLDAETLAAWADDSLQSHERQAAEDHLAGCARCRTILATIVRTEPAIAETTELPAVEAAPWWRKGWHLGWLVPLTAGAVAVAFWIALPGDRTLPDEVSQQAAAPASNAPSLAERTTPERTPASPPTSSEAISSAPSSLATRGEPQALKAEPETARQDSSERPQADRAPDAEAAVQAADAGAEAATVQTETRPRTDQVVGGVAGGVVTTAPAHQRAVLGRAAVTITIQSPDGNSRWRSSPAGIEHSSDGGTTWTIQRSGAPGITSGDAPSPEVCWFVGARGIVLVTTDGQTWTERQIPLPLDLAGIDAADGQRATVVTRDGRRFATTDGGVSWSDSSLQGF